MREVGGEKPGKNAQKKKTNESRVEFRKLGRKSERFNWMLSIPSKREEGREIETGAVGSNVRSEWGEKEGQKGKSKVTIK